MKRSGIDVIEMCVRQKDDVDPGQLIDRERRLSQSFRTDGEQKWDPNSYPRKQNRIGENIDPEKVDQHGGVPKPRCGHLLVAPFGRIRFGKCRRDWPRTLEDRFAP